MRSLGRLRRLVTANRAPKDQTDVLPDVEACTRPVPTQLSKGFSEEEEDGATGASTEREVDGKGTMGQPSWREWLAK